MNPGNGYGSGCAQRARQRQQQRIRQRMSEPTGCVLWADPSFIDRQAMKESFEQIGTFQDESHWRQYLLKCRECGQLYFFEFYEEVDWQDGDDPQFCTWVPIASEQDMGALVKAEPLGVRQHRPRLHKDWPKGMVKPDVFWVKSAGQDSL